MGNTFTNHTQKSIHKFIRDIDTNLMDSEQDLDQTDNDFDYTNARSKDPRRKLALAFKYLRNQTFWSTLFHDNNVNILDEALFLRKLITEAERRLNILARQNREAASETRRLASLRRKRIETDKKIKLILEKRRKTKEVDKNDSDPLLSQSLNPSPPILNQQNIIPTPEPNPIPFDAVDFEALNALIEESGTCLSDNTLTSTNSLL